MGEFLDFFDSENFLPHGHCFLWLPQILWLHVISDALIALAYFLIPVALFYLVSKRKDLPYKPLFAAFSTFILLCGTTHLFSIWVLWYPDYALEGLVKAATAVMSLATVVVLWRAIPKILELIQTTDEKASAAKFQLLANTLPQLAWMADETGWVFWFNQRFYEYTGKTEKEIEGWGWESVHDPEVLPLVLKNWQASLSTGIPFEMVFPIKGADGLFRNFLTRINPILDKNHNVTQWFGSGTDITEQHNAEMRAREALHQEESERTKLLALIEHTPAYIGIADMEGNLQYHNPAAKLMLGLPDDQDMSKLKVSDVYPLWAQKLRIEKALPAINSKGVWKGETALLHRDGHEIPVSQVLTLYRDANGNPVSLTTIMLDITASKAQQQALETSESTFRSAMESASIGMALVSTDGTWLKVNPALCELFGYSEQELLSINFQKLTHPDDLEQNLIYARQLAAGEISEYHMEKRYFHRNGHTIWALLSVALVRDNASKPKYFISQIQDISERKEMERIKTEFISIVSHELRTPLTSIRGSLGLVVNLFMKELPDKAKTLLDIAYSNCERLISLINDILDIDKIAAGQMRFDMKEESVAQLTFKAAEMNQAYAEKFRVTIDVKPIPAEIRINVDESRYIQALSNLLSNAAKFSSPDTKITVAAVLDQKTVRISVSDQGSGVPEEFRSRIFAKFSQADSSSTRIKGGTGLGLHITKQIVEKMRGKIGFDSEAGKGTVFWLEFPVENSTSVKDDKNIVQQEKKHTSTLPSILYIEDDADLSQLLVAALSDKADVRPANTLREAERLIRKENFSLIILDIGMPDGSGLDLLARINEMTTSPPPVIILSATEPSDTIRSQVAATIIKSKIQETKIVEIILSTLQEAENSKTPS